MIPKLKNIISYLIPIVVERRKGEISPRLEIAIENGRYVLNTEHYNYSFGGLHRIFEKAFKKIKFSERKVENVLVLGFGTGSVAELLLEEYEKDCKITGVERDAVVIQLAHEYFKIDRFKDLVIYHADAHSFVKTCKEKFDLIIIDVFIGGRTPPHLEEEIFLEHISRLLSANGMVLYNRAFFDGQSRKDTVLLAEKMNQLIGKTTLIKISAYGLSNAILVSEKID